MKNILISLMYVYFIHNIITEIFKINDFFITFEVVEISSVSVYIFIKSSFRDTTEFKK